MGDYLFDGELDEGIAKYIIIAKRDDGACVIAAVREFEAHLEISPFVSVAREGMCGTLEEAVQRASEYEIEYCDPRLEYARAALDAVTLGKDLTPYLDGFKGR